MPFTAYIRKSAENIKCEEDNIFNVYAIFEIVKK